MTSDQPADIDAEEAKLERAAEKHDWAEEIVDDAVEGLASPLTRDDPEDAKHEPLKKGGQ